MNTWFHVDVSPMGSGERSLGGGLAVDKTYRGIMPQSEMRELGLRSGSTPSKT